MSQITRRIALLFCFTLSLGVLSNSTQAQTLTVLHNFSGGGDGAYPLAGLTMDRAGNLYGTTANGGAYNVGVVFRLSRAGSSWVLKPLYTFTGGADGGYPYSGVVIGPDGGLYGTTNSGGVRNQGTVYRLVPSPAVCHAVTCPWEETVIHSFPSGGDDGSFPEDYGNLVFDHAGNIYGTTELGGFGGGGAVFELSPSNGGWTESVIWHFVTQTGYDPFSGLIFDSSGNLYGTTTAASGAGNYGVVYQLSPSGSGWTENVLSYIGHPAGAPSGGVVVDGQGDVFGAASCFSGGVDPGEVFELTPSNGGWAFNVLHTFSGSGTGPCDSPTLDAAGNVYGTSSGTGSNSLGEVYKLTPSNGGWSYSSVSFAGSNGAFPEGSVIFDAAGNMYGTAAGGGSGPCESNGNTGCGVIWMITP